MQYISDYISPLGKICLMANNETLTGLYFYNQKNFPNIEILKILNKENKIIYNTKSYLDDYFAGKNPIKNIPIMIEGTNFQKLVWNLLLQIPYGSICTYSYLAQKIANMNNTKKVAYQAVGHAIGRNKISIIIPCHRVIGKDNSLKGYAAGLDKKIYLLKLENAILP